MDNDVRVRDQRPRRCLVADVADDLLDGAVQPRVVERHEIERADVVTVGREPPRQMQAEEARSTRDRDPQRVAGVAWVEPDAGRAGGAELTSTAAASSTPSATDISPRRLRRSATGASPRSSLGLTRK